MNNNALSQAAVGLILEELGQFGKANGFKLIASVELNPEDPDTMYALSVCSPEQEWVAKFLGKTQLEAARGALHHMKSLMFNVSGQSNHPHQPLKE